MIWTEHALAGDPHRADDKDRRVRAMFSAIARRYDLNNRLHSFGRDQAWRRRAVRLADVRPGEHVLDVACGTGDLAEAFAEARPARVVGLDFAEPMLDLARQKAARRGRSEHAPTPEYVHGDAMHLPFDEQSFDIISIAFGIRNVADPGHVAGEFHRVLRPGGRVVILEFSEPDHKVLRFFNRIYCAHIMPITATLIARDRTGAYRYLPRSVQTFLDRQALADLLRDNDFVDVQQHPMTFGVCAATIARKDRRS